MAYYPICLFPPQWHVDGAPASGYVLKAYQDGTSTLLQMATDNTGATLVNTITLNTQGYPSVSGNIVVPHVDQACKLALYPSQSAADANSGAVWNPDNLVPYNVSSNLSFSGNTIASTNSNGNIILDPNGTGEILLNAVTNIQTLELAGVEVVATAAEINSACDGSASGTFTGTLTGMASATTGTVHYRISGELAFLWIQSNITGTSNSTALTMTGLPAALQPAATRAGRPCGRIVDNGSTFVGGASVTNDTITFSLLRSSGSNYVLSTSVFTNSGTKGLEEGWGISYSIR